jgi:hypothetical protein
MLFSGSGTTPPPAQTGSAATVAGRASTVIRFVSASGSGRSPFGVVAEEVKSCR